MRTVAPHHPRRVRPCYTAPFNSVVIRIFIHRIAILLVAFAFTQASICGQPVGYESVLELNAQTVGAIYYSNPLVGYDFTTTNGLEIAYLGVFDLKSDDLAGPHEVGLWNRNTGELLAHATVDNSAFLQDSFRWQKVPKVMLHPGVTYNISSYSHAEDPIYSDFLANTRFRPDVNVVQGYLELLSTDLHIPTSGGFSDRTFVGPAFGSALHPLQPHLEWVRTYSLDPAKINQTVGIVLAPDGGVIISGSSANTNGDLDYALIKYQPNGDTAWLRRFDDAGANDQARRHVIAPNGNTTIIGTTKTVSFNAAGDQLWAAPYAARDVAVDSDHVYVTGFSDIDFATAKISAINGTNIWTQTYNNATYNRTDLSQVLTLDKDGNVYVAGPEPDFCSRTSCNYDVRLFKYSPTGATLATQQTLLGVNPTQITLRRLLCDSYGKIFFVGDTVFPEIRFLTYGYSSGLSELGFKWFLDQDDGYSSGAGEVATAALDPSGNLYMAGLEGVTGYLTTIKLQPDGHKAWRHGINNNISGARSCGGMAIDTSGNTYTVGQLPVVVDGVEDVSDIVVIKHDGNGNENWVSFYDSPFHKSDIATGVVLDPFGNIYVTGYSTTPQGGTEFLTLKYSQLPKIEKLTTGAIRLQFLAPPSAAYILQTSTNLVDWNDIQVNVADSTGFVQFDDSGSTSFSSRFYRGKTSP